ncbi:hypothetical protein HT031_000982 [Scenedesmus sp. PABB004]|nr:hypothetical protein HT031_000982 [Scenedesmus sp. PABB004]
MAPPRTAAARAPQRSPPRALLLLWLGAALAGVAGGAAPPQGVPTQAMGFHEGARRLVRCDGGFVTGFDVHLGRAVGFAELSVQALRVKCSSGRLDVEFEGTGPDTRVFGNPDPGTTSSKPVDCPRGQGVAAIEWRRANSAEKDHTARVGGLRLHCSSERSAAPVVLDASGQETVYPLALKCSETVNAPRGEHFRAVAVEVWYEQLFSGLHLAACQADAD